METIEAIFESYKESNNEETPYTKDQQDEFDAFSRIIDEVFSGGDTVEYRKQQLVFENAVGFARASEKSGFITGFKMAMNIMHECRQ